MNKSNYTSASSFPQKLLHNEVVKGGKIKPIHAQIIPTNKCNLNCEFCSCRDRNKSGEIPIKELKQIFNILKKHETKAVTITGGGEPLLYKEINEIINHNNFQVGLVTNGILLDNLKKEVFWCRISSSDDRIPAFEAIERAVKRFPKTDWAFSHVLTEKSNYESLKELVLFANKHKFTHIRIVPDLFNIDKVDIEKAKEVLSGIDERVIYQDRSCSTKGTKDCYISLLKPVISPEGVFPCCGSQYAITGSKKEMIGEMRVNKSLDEFLDKQEPFNGSKCDVCYYQGYNDLLKILKDKPKHINFL